MGFRTGNTRHWTFEEYDELSNLLSEIASRPPPGNPFAPPRPETSGDLAAEWKQLNANALYCRLRTNEDFVSFFEGFRTKRAVVPAVAAEARIEFRFLKSVLRNVESYYLRSQLRREKQARRQGTAAIRKNGRFACSDERKAAKKAVESLLRARTNGVGMADCLDDIKLFELLGKLGHELGEVRQKKRQTVRSLQAKLLNDVAEDIALAIGDSSPRLLKEFMRWVGFAIDDSRDGKIAAVANTGALANPPSSIQSLVLMRTRTMQ